MLSSPTTTLILQDFREEQAPPLPCKRLFCALKFNFAKFVSFREDNIFPYIKGTFSIVGEDIILPFFDAKVTQRLPCVKGGGIFARKWRKDCKNQIPTKNNPSPANAGAPFTQGSLFIYPFHRTLEFCFVKILIHFQFSIFNFHRAAARTDNRR